MDKIKITLVSGKNLMAARSASACDPFVTLKLGTQKYISTVKHGINPVWNEGFVFNVPRTQPILHLDVADRDRIKITYSTNIGSVDVDLSPYMASLPQQFDVRTKYGSLTLIVANPNAAPSLGNTQGAKTAIATQGIKTSSAKPATTTITTATKPVQPTTKPPTPSPVTSASGQYASSLKPTTTTTTYASHPPSSSSKPHRPHRHGGGRRPKRPHHATEVYAKYDPSFSQLDEDEVEIPIPDLPASFDPTEAELAEQRKRWARFAVYLAKPYEYESKYKKYLQQLDAMGAINLERVKRDQIPSIEINYCAALFFNPYEDLPHTLDMGPVNDALRMAELFISRGYRVVYLCDATPRQYYRWMDWLLSTVEDEIVSYFSGHGTQIPDKTGKEKDGLSEVLVFYDATRKKKAKGGVVPKLTPIQGITTETIDDTCLHNLIVSKEYPDTRVILISDCCHSGTMFNFDQKLPAGGNRLTPPPNVVCIGSALDSQTAKQTAFQGKDTGVFTYNFTTLLKAKPTTTFLELQAHMAKQIKQYQTIQLTGTDSALYSMPIVIDVPTEEQEMKLNEITTEILGATADEITSIPDVDVPSAIEQEIAKVNWNAFCDELAKPAPYTSKYKTHLQKLDGMGAINLERITRDQIPPNIYIDKCAALFFCPYEDLPHTLDLGPVNDAVLMAELFLSRGYHVMYICDATPHEYYRWMDWLLENVENEIVCTFSGHGTQIPDVTGKEKDGLSEVLVFYDSTRKKKAKGGVVPKLTPIQGITNETVDDICMFDLITSKEYPETRVVLLTDCCHSGTMFNFDQEIPGSASLTTPPLNVVCVGSALDSQTAKQTSFKGVEAGVFTYNFVTLLNDKPNATFHELQSYMSKNIQRYQTIQLTGSSPTLYNQPIIKS